MTTIKISTTLRDQIASVAAEDYGGATLAETLSRLIEEHIERRVLEEYARLQEDPEEWASYLEEAKLSDNVAGDWLRSEADA